MKRILILPLVFLALVSLTACDQGGSKSTRPDVVDPNNPSTPDPNNPAGCIAVDTDGDGLRDCIDPDIDNDGYINTLDKFPYNRHEWTDSDNDGIGDNSDWAPLDPLESKDSDLDDIGDNADPDDDNDGVPDRWDSFRTDNREFYDVDFDGLGGEVDDPDSDNDGVPNRWDDLFYKAGGFDIDHDLVPAESDADIDGDNTLNEQDAFPFDRLEWLDNDGDKLGNNADPDDDNDAIPDGFDDFPLNRLRQFDSDKDGFANEDDRFPFDPTEWADNDNDGVGDNSDAFPNNPLEWADTDADGVGNNSDPDIDGDGYLNQTPAKEVLDVACFAQPNQPACDALGSTRCVFLATNQCVPKGSCAEFITQSSCTGTVGCNWTGNNCEQADFLPLDKNEHLDYDLDGLGNGEDPDDDNDGFPDVFDNFSLRADIYLDDDNDTLHDWIIPRRPTDYALLFPGQALIKVDPDSDNDGVPDFWDDLAWDPVEYFDIDNDGLGANIDQDDDNDGVADIADTFPFDSTETGNNDGDAFGNNLDPDDDNDGVPDVFDSLPFNSFGFSDLDADGVSDQQDQDLDNDTYGNGTEMGQEGLCASKTSQSTCQSTLNCFWNPGDNTCKTYGYFNVTCVGSPNNFTCDYTNSENRDKFEFDNTEWLDSDNDLIGNNIDPDDDNDGVPDLWDNFKENRLGWSDIDGDGIPEQDLNGDGIIGNFNPTDSSDDNEDSDIDGDNVTNDIDAFPYDKFEQKDGDLDGIGDNTDPDDDNDGVPDLWDDQPENKFYFWDTDGDGLPTAGWDPANPSIIKPNLDPYTPNGINNEAELLIALSHNETVALTSDVTITQCVPIGLEVGTPTTPVFSTNKGIRKLIYNGANGGCMLYIRSDYEQYPLINNIHFVVPATKSDVVIIKTDEPIKDVLISNNIFDIKGSAKIADIYLRDIVYFTRNNIELSQNVTASALNSGLINLRSTVTRTGNINTSNVAGTANINGVSNIRGLDIDTIVTGTGIPAGATIKEVIRNANHVATGVRIEPRPTANASNVSLTFAPGVTSAVGFTYIGNIFFWDIHANQTQQLSLIKTPNRIRYLAMSYNVFNFKKDGIVTMGSPAALVDVDFDGSITGEINSLEFVSNRVNMNTGQFLKISSSNSSLAQSQVRANANKIFGITSMGHPFADRLDGAPDCGSFATEIECSGQSSCQWDGGACGLSSTSKSYENYYDFAKSDVWLAPQHFDYAMHYFPNTLKVNQSPALFPSEVKNQQLDVTYVEKFEENNLGIVYFIGAYKPVRDDDGDTFRDSIDRFPLNASEWFDADLDSIGNNFDPDDDNDTLADTNEKSACKAFQDQIHCEEVSVCSWDSSVYACKHKPAVGCIAGTTWNSTNNCCIDSFNVCKDGSDPFAPDTDLDGLTDVREINGITVGSNTYKTNPLVADTDGDNDTDSEEIANGTNPLDPNSSKDTDGDGLNDNYERNTPIFATCTTPWLFADSDGDGLNDNVEISLSTNPCNADSDGDGLTDKEEVQTYLSNPNMPDTDGDGLNDGYEVRTLLTSPTLADTDGDGAKDGQEVTDGTDPRNNASFKDTDEDGESDYADQTPFGVANCDNTTLSQCTNVAFNSNATLITEFVAQYQTAVNCSTKTDQTTCNSQFRDMCKWNTGSSKCEAKSINLYYDITFDRCPTAIISSASVKIRSATTASRKKIVLPATLLSSATCSFNAAGTNKLGWMQINSDVTGHGGKLALENLRVEGTGIPYLFTSTDFADNVATPAVNELSRGSSITTNKVEFHLTSRGSGISAIRAYNPALVDMEKTTIRSIIPYSNIVNGSVNITNTSSAGVANVFGLSSTAGIEIGMPASGVNIPADAKVVEIVSGTSVRILPNPTSNSSSVLVTFKHTQANPAVDIVNNDTSSTTAVNLKGLLVECDTQNKMSYMVTNAVPHNCIRTQADTTLFDGNVVMLKEANGLSPAEFGSANNLLYSWNHTQGSGSFILRNSRLYSSAKTMSVNNSGSVTATSFGLRNGENNANFDWTGAGAPVSPAVSVLGTDFMYGTTFASASSAKVACVSTGSQAQIGDAQIHPAYFSSTPSRSFWNLINRTSTGDQVQVPGAVSEAICP